MKIHFCGNCAWDTEWFCAKQNQEEKLMTGFGGFGFLFSPSSEGCWSFIHLCAEGEGFFLSLMGVAFKPCSCSHFIVHQPLLFPVLLIGNPQFVGAACVSQSWLTGVSVHSLHFTGLPFYSQFMAASLSSVWSSSVPVFIGFLWKPCKPVSKN